MPGRNFATTAALTAGLLLALPGGAHAATTYTVDPKAPAACSGTTCGTIEAALGKAAAGDKLSLQKGVFQEAPLVVATPGLTIEAVPGTAAITSKSTTAGADVLRIDAAGVTLKGLTIGVQPAGGSAVVVAGTGATIDGSTLVNQAAGGPDVAVLELVAPSGTTTVRSSIVVHTPDLAAAGGAPAIQGAGASSLLLEGSQAISGPESGPAVALPGNADTPNRIVRSGLLSLRADGDALHVSSAADSATAKHTIVDSSVLGGGASGAGLRTASLAGGLLGSSAGPIDVDLFHATIAGAAHSIVIDAAANGSGLGASPKGAIDVRAERSIVHGDASVQNFDGSVPLLTASNTATLAVVGSDTAIQPFDESGSTITTSGNVLHPDAALFADPGRRIYLLRPDAPVIDKGGPLRDGGTDKDVEGEPRLTGAATDLGADEFVNKPPVAKLAAPAQVPEGQAVTLDATGSVDPEGRYGGGIKQYVFDFGDGTPPATSTVAQVQHTYAKRGSYQARVAVVDVAGAISNVATTTIQVTDGVAPTVRIAQPRNNQAFTLRESRRVRGKDGKVRTVKRARLIRFQGTAQDESGVRSVELSFRLGSPSGRTCRFLDVKKQQIVGRPCAKPIFFPVAVRDGIWSYRTKSSTKLRAGSYLVTVRATDRSGVTGEQRVRLRLR